MKFLQENKKILYISLTAIATFAFGSLLISQNNFNIKQPAIENSQSVLGVGEAAWSVDKPFYGDTELELVSDGSGGFYTNYRDGSFVTNIQHLDSNGNEIFAETVSSVIPDCQRFINLLPDGSGGVVIFFQIQGSCGGNAEPDLYMQRIDSDGNLLLGATGVLLETDAHSFSSSPLMIFNASENMLMYTYGLISVNNFSDHIWAQKVNLSGTKQWGGGVQLVNAGTQMDLSDATYTSHLTLSLTDDNQYIVAMLSRPFLGSSDIYVQKLNSAGTKQWGSSGVIAITDVGNNMGSVVGVSMDIVSDGSNGIIIGCGDHVAGEVLGQRLNSAGTKQWTDNLQIFDHNTDTFSSVEVVASTSGGSFWFMQDYNDPSGFGRDYVNKVDASGNLLLGAGGQLFANFPYDEYIYDAESNGSGGAFVVLEVVQDEDYNTADIIIQEILSDGSEKYANGGAVVDDSAGYDCCGSAKRVDEDAYFVVWQGEEAEHVARFQIAYQIDNLDAGLDILDSDGNNIEIGSAFGERDSDTLRLKDNSNSLVLADVTTNMSADRDWSSVTGDSDLPAKKSFVHNIIGSAGVGSSYSLYVPKGAGDTGVLVCPGATSLAAVTTACGSGVKKVEADSDVSVVNINSQDYWKIDNVTGTGGMSVSTIDLDIAPSDTTIAVGESITLSVTAKDVLNNTDTAYVGTVTFDATGGTVDLPADYTYLSGDAGTKDFSATFPNAGAFTVTVTDTLNGSLTATTADITVTETPEEEPEPEIETTSLVVTPSKFSVLTAESFSVTLTAKDINGNTNPDYRGTVHFTSTAGSATLPGNYTFNEADAGTHTFNGVIFNVFGTYTISATDINDSDLTHTSGLISVLPIATNSITAEPNKFSLLTNEEFDLVVTAKDTNNNTNPDFRDTIRFTSTSYNIDLPVNYTFSEVDAGVHTFTDLKFTKAGEFTITIIDNDDPNIFHTTATITVKDVAKSLSLVSDSYEVLTGSKATLTLSALNENNEVDKNYSGTISFSIDQPGVEVPKDYTFETDDQGVFQFEVTFPSEGAYKITARDLGNDELIVTSETINVFDEILSFSSGEVQTSSLSTQVIEFLGRLIEDPIGTIDAISERDLPLVLVTTSAGTIAINAISYNRFILYGFLWFKKRKKESAWGIVYNQRTKEPLSFTVIRLNRFENGKKVFLTEKLSSINGKYSINTEPGLYSLEAKHPGYKAFIENIKVEKNGLINIDIPLTKYKDSPKSKISYTKILHLLSNGVFYGGSTIAFISLIFSPNMLNIGVSSLYALQLLFLFRLRENKSGVVYDEKTANPLPKAFIRIFDKNSGSQSDMDITNDAGKYSITLPKGDYLVKVEAPGYKLSESKKLKTFSSPTGDRFLAITIDKQQLLNIKVPMVRDEKVKDTSLNPFG